MNGLAGRKKFPGSTLLQISERRESCRLTVAQRVTLSAAVVFIANQPNLFATSTASMAVESARWSRAADPSAHQRQCGSIAIARRRGRASKLLRVAEKWRANRLEWCFST